MGIIEVTGRNGYIYPARPLNVIRGLYVVGKFIVVVEDGRVTDTVCKATKANVKAWTA